MLDVPISKRDKILDAAAELIVTTGLQCSMAAIADLAGVATGSLYNYFSSKDELVRGVYTLVGEKMAAAVIVDHPIDTPHEQRIKRYISDYIAFILEDPRRQRLFEYLDNAPELMHSQLTRPELSASEIATAFSSFLTYSGALFAEAQQAGVLREGSAYLLGSFVRGAIRHSIKRRRMVDPDPIATSECDVIADMCWRAVTVLD